MAVERVWFHHVPDGVIGAADRARQGIGYGGINLIPIQGTDNFVLSDDRQDFILSNDRIDFILSKPQ